MKTLILLSVLLVSTVSMAECKFGLDVKKAGAKTAYARGGVSISSKIRAALESQGCKITYNVMTKSQVKSMKMERLTKQLAKLKSE